MLKTNVAVTVSSMGACVAVLALLAPACGGSKSAEPPKVTPDGTQPPVDAGSCDFAPELTGDPCTDAVTPGTDRECTFTFAGKSRSFLVYAPKSYDPCKATPVVVDAHGRTESAKQHAGLERFREWPEGLGSGWRLVADREGFLVISPQGIDDEWVEKDADFILEVDTMVKQVANVDAAKVFLTGISNGGMLSYWTACRDANVFRGFSPISGASAELVEDAAGACPIANPTPLIAFHAKKDPLIPYSAGKASASAWAKRNKCTSGPSPSLTFGGPNTDTRELCLEASPGDETPWRLVKCSPSAAISTCETWEGCAGGGRVTFCDVNGETQPVGGHILYFNDTKLSVAAVAWEFFKGM